MPPKKGQKKRRAPKEPKPKYVFKVVKPSTTPYKQPQSETRNLPPSGESTITNLLRQQQQQQAIQQQVAIAGLISQLGSLSRKPAISEELITADGKPLMYPMAKAEVIRPYQPEARVSEAFVEPKDTPHMMEKEEMAPPSWYVPKEERSVWRDIEPVLEPWNPAQRGLSPFEEPPAEKVIRPVSPPREKERPPEKERPLKQKEIDALTRRRDELVKRGEPWSVNEAKIVFGFDLRTKAGKETLKQLISDGLIKD